MYASTASYAAAINDSINVWSSECSTLKWALASTRDTTFVGVGNEVCSNRMDGVVL